MLVEKRQLGPGRYPLEGLKRLDRLVDRVDRDAVMCRLGAQCGERGVAKVDKLVQPNLE